MSNSNSSSSNSQQIAYLNRVASSIQYYDNIIYLSVGIPLNVVNAVVFARLLLNNNKNNKTNMGFFRTVSVDNGHYSAFVLLSRL